MSRLLGQFVAAEMAVLGLCELALSFLAMYAMLGALGSPLIVPAAGMAAAPPDSADLAAVLALTVAGTAAAIGLYRPEMCLERRRLLVNAALAGVLALPAVLLVSGGFHIVLSPHAVVLFAKVLLVWLGCIVATRTLFNRIMRERWFVRRILVLGSSRHIGRLRKLANAGRGRLFEPVAPPQHAGAGAVPLTHAALQRQQIWGILVAKPLGEVTELPLETLLDCKLRGIPVFDEASFSEQHLGRIDLDGLRADWLLFGDGFANTWISSAAKRGFDIVVSLTLLLLTLPLMLLTALLIKLDSAGPVLYRQQRAGLHGKPFTLLKFRSMTVDAERAGDPRWTSRQDPRITRLGYLIRPMRIDELPQLLNVLRGEMSMIGPRPERPHFVEQLARVIPFYRERGYVKPGLTGWAQVNYPYGASVEDARRKLSYDLYYVKNRNLLLDILILFATIRVILFREGAR